MKAIYIIVENQKETLGHGHFEDMYKIETYCIDGKNRQIYPVFKSKMKAEKYWIKKQIEFWNYHRPEMSKSEINHVISGLDPQILKLPIV